MENLIEVPTITSSAMLVEVNIKCWTARVKDKRASEEVTQRNNADKKTATVTKKLLGDCVELDQLEKYSKRSRNASYERTLPWTDGGDRLLTTEQMFDFTQQMSEWEQGFYKLVDVFDQRYPFLMTQAQASLGTLFNPSDYPHPDDIRGKFRFRVIYKPIAESDDFRVDIGVEGNRMLATQYEDHYDEQIQKAMGNLWERMNTCLTNMSSKLSEPEDTDNQTKTVSKTFRNTLFTNTHHMLDMMKTCNITGDSRMEAIRRSIEDSLHGITPDAVRQDSRLRAETKRAMDDAIAQIPTLDM